LARTCRLSRAAGRKRARQFADRRIEQVEGFTGFERNLDLAALAIAERFAVRTRNQADPAQMRDRARDHQTERREGEQHDRQLEVADEGNARPEPGDEQAREAPGDDDAGDEEDGSDHVGLSGRRGCGEE
jgi:hypothetical protein